MHRYTISVEGTDHEVDVEEVTSNTFRVQVAGKSVDVRLRDHQDLSQAMITPQIEVAHRSEGMLPPAPSTAPAPAAAARAATTPAPSAAVGASAPAAGGAKSLTAPMPGVVLSIQGQVGQAVKRGDPLLVLEAMKMKNELRASRDGVVAAIKVEVGQQVSFGDALVVFE